MTTPFIVSPLEVRLKKSDDLLKIRETLTRIGIASQKNKTLWQSCHILHKQGKYYIVHFKEMMALDGKETTLTDSDVQRRNTIAKLLQEWGLLTIVLPEYFSATVPLGQIKVLPHREKADWILMSKYDVGKFVKE
jgi:hypothetical protein